MSTYMERNYLDDLKEEARSIRPGIGRRNDLVHPIDCACPSCISDEIERD